MKITKCSSTIRSHSEITYLGLACSGTSWPIKALITMTGKSEHSYTLYLQFTVQGQNKIMACFIQLVDICLVSSRSNCKSFSELLFQAWDRQFTLVAMDPTGCRMQWQGVHSASHCIVCWLITIPRVSSEMRTLHAIDIEPLLTHAVILITAHIVPECGFEGLKQQQAPASTCDLLV